MRVTQLTHTDILGKCLGKYFVQTYFSYVISSC
jgi:hypothetical protein